MNKMEVNMISKEDIVEALQEIGVIERDEENGLYAKIEDSLTYISTVVLLEEKFEIEFEDEQLIGTLFNSLDELTAIINQLTVAQMKDLYV